MKMKIMKMKKSVFVCLYLIAAGQLFLAKSAQALTFDFSWRSDAPGLRVLRGPRGPHVATGTLDINVTPQNALRGNYFTNKHISNVCGSFPVKVAA